MSVGVLTLEYLGQEKSFTELQIDQSSAELSVGNMAIDTFSFIALGQTALDDPIWPHWAKIIIRKDRVQVGGVWSGGTIEFSGKRMKMTAIGRPNFEGVRYQFGGPWLDLEATCYQQVIRIHDGSSDPHSYTNKYVSDLMLYFKVTTTGTLTYLNTGQQIQDAAQFLLNEYVIVGEPAPFQIGTIDVAANLVTYECKDRKCSEVIRMCLAPNPDATVWFDYGFNPPKLNVTRRVNLAPITLGYKNASDAAELQITPRPDLQLAGVNLYFKITNTINGQPLTGVYQDSYPVGCPAGGPYVLVQTIDLQGYSINMAQGSLVCRAVGAAAADQATRKAWWGLVAPELVKDHVTVNNISDASFFDDQGNPISSPLVTLPNQLLDGSSLATWMKLHDGTQINAQRVTVMALITYDQFDASGQKMFSYIQKMFTTEITVTNGITGDYTTQASGTSGDPVPTGLAKWVYDACSALQYEAEDIRSEDSIAIAVTMGNALNLSGGRAEWATMKGQIQRIHKNYASGQTTINIGPANHLSATDWTQLFLINRWRITYQNPATRTDPTSTRGVTQLGTNVARQDTQGAQPNLSLHTVSAPTPPGAPSGNVSIIADTKPGVAAGTGKLQIGITNPGAATLVPGAGSATIKIGDCNGRDLTVQLFQWKDKDSCATYQAYFLMSPPELVP